MLPLQRFENFIAGQRLFTATDYILVAVSGGRDSVVLAHLLKQAGFKFGIAHCNFQLRPDEAAAEQHFTQILAQSLQVPFYTTSFDTQTYAAEKGISTQMAARQLRYHWFEEIRQQHQYTHIAVAHHQNDSVETILLNLTRGTGIAGMHGILPKNGNIIRPLLFLTRQEIDDIVEDNNLQYMEDSSNASSKYARNKIRLEVIPKLKELNPKLEDTFNANITRFRELEVLLQQQLAQLKTQILVEQGGNIHIAIEAIKQLMPQRLLLFGLFNPYGFSEQVIGDVLSSLDKHSGRTFEAPGYLLVLDRDKLILTPRNNQGTPSVIINKADHEVIYGNYRLNLLHDDSPLIVKNNPMAFSADADQIIFPLTIRGWHLGDYFYPLGMKGHKKVSDYLVNQKVPVNQKQHVPVLQNGNGEIIWICGYRPDDRYKVKAHTKKVIIFELYN